jgi:hypothetical protein
MLIKNLIISSDFQIVVYIKHLRTALSNLS